MINLKRIRSLKETEFKDGPVVYWMSRDQRVNDNWALLFAQETARKKNQKLVVIFCLVDDFLEATIRQYDFMLKGLQIAANDLSEYNIPFHLLSGPPVIKISEFIMGKNAGCLITDFDPLKIKKEWKAKVKDKIIIPFYEVDSHNIIPCWITSDKEEYAARTIRPKIHKYIPEFLEEYPLLQKMPPPNMNDNPLINWNEIHKSLKINSRINKVDWINPGEKEALKTLNYFLEKNLKRYNDKRNDPAEKVQSNLSPYLHFGHISSQRAVLNYLQINKLNLADPFLEEIIVRKELSDNFCFYNNNYNSFEGYREWAKSTLNYHRTDKRPYIYSLDEFENANTQDALWNAAQTEMLQTGKMHGYMRMYWAKKILEWTSSPEEAIKTATYLNDKYELDGRDPNGYTGIAWSIGGIHDRPWFERAVFGKIRYMNLNGLKRKFDIKKYINSLLG